MKTQAQDLFRNRCKFEVSLRYELFYSLNVLLDPASRIHPGWRKQSLKSLGPAFEMKLNEVGSSWEIWGVIASLLPRDLSKPTYEEIKSGLKNLDSGVFQEKFLLGKIHSENAVHAILKKNTPLRRALAKIPKAKQEWLNHVGLFPFDPRSPHAIALEKLIAEPEAFRDSILGILDLYWEKVFRTTWQRVLPPFQKSIEERERLFHSCSFSEFVKQALLRIDVSEKEGSIRAIRGGYRLLFQDISTCYFVPSAFNDRRFWSAFREDGKQTTVYFPCFDPSIALDLQIAEEVQGSQLDEPKLDPALIFKALGDSTRFAIATILARSPKNSVELSKMLSVSKPTISHHVHLLREAGLIQETYMNGSLELQLKRLTLEKLSGLTIAKLFDATEPVQLMKTRGGAVL